MSIFVFILYGCFSSHTFLSMIAYLTELKALYFGGTFEVLFYYEIEAEDRVGGVAIL